MTGHFVGFMPKRAFLDTYLSLRRGVGQAPAANFRAVWKSPGPSHEKEMYQPMIDEVERAGLCPGMRLINNSDHPDKDSGLKPDVEMRQDDDDEALALPNDFKTMQLFAEFKRVSSQDVFVSNAKKEQSIEKETGNSPANRGQITTYATTQMAYQHRLFLFSLIFCGSRARFIRWDRAGAIVSEDFNYITDPELLAEFFWRFSHLTPEQRGFDPTATLATEKESTLLTKAVNDYLNDVDASSKRNLTQIKQTQDETYPTYKLRVDSDDGPLYFIVRKPFSLPMSPCGRATRAYAAYHLKEKRLVFLKDSWRTEHPGLLSEIEVYARLAQSNVPHLPIIIAGGDVLLSPKGGPQKTFTQTLCADSGPAWAKEHKCGSLRAHVHHRIVQELALPLIAAENSKEVVQAMRDAMASLYTAYHPANLLHRDISINNIMLEDKKKEPARGILNDWDHCRDVNPEGERQTYRTGTWQFISIRLLANPHKEHEVLDDLESCFWVLTYMAIHHFKHSVEYPDLAFFDEERSRINAEKEFQSVGGAQKRSVILDNKELHSFIWECAPLNDLIHAFGDIIGRYIELVTFSSANEFPGFAEALELRRKELEEPTKILALFDEALSRSDWHPSDMLPNQFPPQKERKKYQNDQAVRSSQMMSTRDENMNYPPSHISLASRSSLPVPPARPQTRATAQRKTAAPAGSHTVEKANSSGTRAGGSSNNRRHPQRTESRGDAMAGPSNSTASASAGTFGRPQTRSETSRKRITRDDSIVDTDDEKRMDSSPKRRRTGRKGKYAHRTRTPSS